MTAVILFRSALGLACFGAAASAQTVTFQHHVLPIFSRSCNACHGDARAGGLDLRTLDSTLTGGASGAIVRPGDVAGSLLWKKIESGAMPMGGKPLPAGELETVRAWIEKGQFSVRPPGPVADPETRARERAAKLWAFQPPRKAQLPKVGGNPVDAFLLAELEARGLTFQPEASREKLIRRAYFDVTGLPPSPEEVRSFAADKSPLAYDNLIDRLLASPRYGERWARHWLDTAGYADSHGYLGDEARREAWRYRDWVIRAFNAGMPYDRFLTDQLAGDQTVEWKYGEALSTEARDKLIATGFLRLTPDGTDNQEIYEIDKQWDALLGVTEVATKAVLGINLNCARCHDHKFDPILQKDYYRVLALYRPVYDPDDSFPAPGTKWLAANLGSLEWPARFVPAGSSQDFADYLESLKTDKRRILPGLYEAARTAWWTSQVEKMPEPLRTRLLEAQRTPEAARDAAQMRLLREYQEKLQISDAELAKSNPEIARLDAEHAAGFGVRSAARPPMLMAAWDVSLNPTTRVLSRGDYESPGEVVPPGVPVALDRGGAPFQLPASDSGARHTGRRLAFAQWLTQSGHPLTARVIVNRVWQYHFGRGIVATPDDFGSQGAAPVHPELLDWLAVDLVENGWSLKRLHRQILLSRAYRQSAEAPPRSVEADPENLLLGRWPARRLEAEAIRDAILSVSGQLNLTMYGPPVAICRSPDGNFRPDPSGRIDGEKLLGQNHTETPCAKPAASLPPDRDPNRRSVYLQIRRVVTDGFLTAFDAPLMDTNAPTRFRSASAQQALSALHNPLMMEASENFAVRVRREALSGIREQIERAIFLAFARPASAAETQFASELIARQPDPARGFRLFCQSLFAANDFLYVD